VRIATISACGIHAFFDLHADQCFLRVAAFFLCGFKPVQGIFHAVFTLLLGQVVYPLFGIIDQAFGKGGGYIGITGNDLHTDHTFGGVISDFDVLFIDLIRLFIGRSCVQPLGRIYVWLGELVGGRKGGV